MKIRIDTELKLQASFRPRKGMGEFSLTYFDELPDGHDYSWGSMPPASTFVPIVGPFLGEFEVTMYVEDISVLTVKWEAENEEEGKYFDGEVFSHVRKDSANFVLIPHRTREDFKDDGFVCARANMDE